MLDCILNQWKTVRILIRWPVRCFLQSIFFHLCLGLTSAKQELMCLVQGAGVARTGNPSVSSQVQCTLPLSHCALICQMPSDLDLLCFPKRIYSGSAGHFQSYLHV